MHKANKRLKLSTVCPHLTCVLCGGYLIDATTIIECLHSFCKTCIVRYLDTSKYCPICEVLVHKTKPLQHIRLDHTLQDLVYKLVPGLFKDEMQQRRDFYRDRPLTYSSQKPVTRLSDTEAQYCRQRVIFSPDENFSVCLELTTNGNDVDMSTGDAKSEDAKEAPDCRYLLCPAKMTVRHLKKFIRSKFSLSDKYHIELYHFDETMKDSYTLVDMAYISSWRRRGPLTIFYSIFKHPVKKMKRPAHVDDNPSPVCQNQPVLPELLVNTVPMDDLPMDLRKSTSREDETKLSVDACHIQDQSSSECKDQPMSNGITKINGLHVMTNGGGSSELSHEGKNDNRMRSSPFHPGTFLEKVPLDNNNTEDLIKCPDIVTREAAETLISVRNDEPPILIKETMEPPARMYKEPMKSNNQDGLYNGTKGVESLTPEQITKSVKIEAMV